MVQKRWSNNWQLLGSYDYGRGYFAWGGGVVDFAAFQAAGLESGGSADTLVWRSPWSCDSP